WLDTTARSNHKLFVFLPGTVVGSATPQRPAQFQLVQQEAARVGYHVVGLMYVNSGGIAQTCPADPDPATCYENARVEVVDRIDAQSVPWVASHMTPSERYYGLAHDRDSFFRPIRASWDSLGIAGFGPAVAPEISEPPYGVTHMLVTDVLPRGGFVGNNARGSVSNDANTPLNPDGTPILEDAWRYLMTARDGREDIAQRDEE